MFTAISHGLLLPAGSCEGGKGLAAVANPEVRIPCMNIQASSLRALSAMQTGQLPGQTGITSSMTSMWQYQFILLGMRCDKQQLGCNLYMCMQSWSLWDPGDVIHAYQLGVVCGNCPCIHCSKHCQQSAGVLKKLQL